MSESLDGGEAVKHYVMKSSLRLRYDKPPWQSNLTMKRPLRLPKKEFVLHLQELGLLHALLFPRHPIRGDFLPHFALLDS
jgi:hypothetical protein